jgi:hypothetical protein
MPRAAESTTVDVTYDAQRGYVGTHPQLPAPVIALSLAALRARVGRQLDVAAVNVRLKLDRAARAQRDVRRRGGAERASDTTPV